MTENKRFTITGDRSISDHQKKRLYDLNDFDGMISVTECLNELNDENEAFKNSDNITELETEIMKLKEENKELRSDRNYWKTLAQSLAKTNGTLKLKDEHIGWKRVDVE